MKRIFCSLFIFFLSCHLLIMAQTAFPLDSIRRGDLLFVENRQGNAITDVTQGFNGKKIDHVGIVVSTDSIICILEACHRGVVYSPLCRFLSDATQNNRSATVWIGRITCKCNIDKSIKNATKYLGRPYDYYFMPDDKEIYCSELVQKSFINDAGKLIFHPIPMSFHDSKGHITHYWQRYYMKRHLKVPEGAPGSNPGELSSNKLIRIMGYYNK
jgi:hypothetical protein